jgi:dTDP-L-rhamnose 4-epimerase
MMSIRTILVTGGAGYIGSHLVDALVTRDYQVTVLDSLEPQVHRSGTWPSYVNARATYVRGDVRDRSVFEPLVLAADAVVHFGAAVSVGQSMYQVDRYVDVNTRGTALLLDILVNAKHHVEKVVVASSIGVYGEGAYRCASHGVVAPGIRPEEQLATRDWEQRCPVCREPVGSIPTPEDKALYRDNIYSMTKYHQEEMVLLIGKTYGIPSVAPRFFNVYGPRQSLSNPYAGVAAIWLSRLLNDRQPVVFEDGGQLRDFVSIHDVVDCLVLMIETSGADYLPVNVGSGEIVTILDIARMLNRILGKSIEPQITQTGRKFDIRHNTADIARARKTLGFRPKVALEDGFTELVEWAETTPDVATDFFDRALDELKQKGLLVKS